ncbi:MAG: BRO family protein [Rugosibacter sp.]|nr:BRO family protein [Rugosibacter sp.]
MTNSLFNSGGTAAALVFESTTFDVVTRNEQPWLRGLQVASALGFKNPSADLKNLYDRNAAEFTPSMTALVKLDTAGGEQTVRCFSLRGAHLLGMFARTDKAAAFRKWVLDILDAHLAQLNHSHTDTLIPSEQQTLSELVHRRVAGADAALQGKALAEIWSRLHHKFRVAKYNQLPRTQLSEAIAYVMQMDVKALPGAKTQAQATTTPPASVAERLSGSDLLNIKRMIWACTRGFFYESSWNQGIWFYLRRVLDTPSPQPFNVEQLPRLAEELQRIHTISYQVQAIIQDIECQATKRIFRKGECADVVLADLKRLADANLRRVNDEVASLPAYFQQEHQGLAMRRQHTLGVNYSNDEKPGYFDQEAT